MFHLKARIRLIIIGTKFLSNLWLGVAVSLILPLSGLAENTTTDIDARFDKNDDGIVGRIDWRKMKDSEKKTYARMSLEAIGENPGATVTKNKSREQLLLEGLEAIYGR